MDYTTYQNLFQHSIAAGIHAAAECVDEAHWMVLSTETQRQLIDRLKADLHESGITEPS